MPETYSYSETRTRAEAVQDQVEMFLMYTGLPKSFHGRILLGIRERWVEALAVYLASENQRVLEAEVRVDWQLHSDFCVVSPVVRGDLPGWSDGSSPEIQVVGKRFGLRARELGITPSFWILFTSTIRNDQSCHQERCKSVGVDYASSAPPWKASPHERSYDIDDLREVRTTIREST